MKLKLIIVAMMLTLAFPAAGNGAVVQEAYEVALSDLRLPRAEGGTIAFKECDKCDYLRLRVSASTTFVRFHRPHGLSEEAGVGDSTGPWGE